MSRRARQRREAIESKYIAMAEDTDDMDWEEDGDFESLALYQSIDDEASTACIQARSGHDALPFDHVASPLTFLALRTWTT